MKVRFTPRAFADMDVIRTYIDQFNPAAAGRVVSLIEAICRRLGDFPEVVILHIRHAARRPIEPNEI